MKTITGTNHFESLSAVYNYYSGYCPNMREGDYNEYIREKLKRKEVLVGKPNIKPGEKLSLHQEERRYFITSSEAAKS